MSGTPNTNGAAHESVSNSDQSISDQVRVVPSSCVFRSGRLFVAGVTAENKRYLQAKTEKLGHLLAQNIEN